jgi:hypothetical protein
MDNTFLIRQKSSYRLNLLDEGRQVELAYSVDEALIDRLCQLARGELHATYLITLRVLIAPREQTVRRNQNLVTRYLDKHDVVPNLCSGPAARKIRQAHSLETVRGRAFINTYTASLELMVRPPPPLVLSGRAASLSPVLIGHVSSLLPSNLK